MKNKFYCFMLLLMIAGKIHGQTYDTIFVYDTIVVYDTIIVYDTIQVSDDNFKQNNVVEQAILEFDTAASKAQLVVFNKKDTATIPINSIIVSETNKNSQTMKKLNLTLAASALLTQMLSAQGAPESITATDVPEKKIVIGAGVSNYGLSTGGLGANLKFDYLLTNRLGVGIKSMFCNNTSKGYTIPAGINGPGYEVDHQSGSAFNFMFTSTYYVIGKNSNNSKGGLYTTLGLGYSSWMTPYTVTYLVPASDTIYYNYSKEWGYKGFDGMIGIGGDRKLGPGRIYFEIPFTLDIYGTHVNIQSSKKGNYDWSNKEFRYFQLGVFLNLGYQFYF